jgi:hypothetical protein
MWNWVVYDAYCGEELGAFISKKLAVVWAEDERERLREMGEDETTIRIERRRVK